VVTNYSTLHEQCMNYTWALCYRSSATTCVTVKCYTSVAGFLADDR